MLPLFVFYSICITIVSMLLAIDLQHKNKSILNLQKLTTHYSDMCDKLEDRIKLLEMMNEDLEKECDELDAIVEVKLFNDFGISKESNDFIIDTQNSLLDIINTIKDVQKANRDTRTKEIGDKVKLWDFSFHRIWGDDKADLDPKYADKIAIVIAVACDIKFKDITNRDRVLDICIRYDDGTKVYTNSEFVKRIDTYEK